MFKQMYVLILLSLLFIGSCSSDDDSITPPKDQQLSVISVNHQGIESYRCAILPTGDWIARCESDWVQINPASGDKSVEFIHIVVLENTQEHLRKTEVIIENTDNNSKIIIPIEQTGFTKELKIEENIFEIDCRLGQDTLKINSIIANAPFIVTDKPEWVDSVVIQHVEDQIYKANIFITSGLDDVERKGEIIFAIDENTQQKVSITIHPYSDVFFDLDPIKIEQFSGTKQTYAISIYDRKQRYVVKAYESEWFESSWINTTLRSKTRKPIESQDFDISLEQFATLTGGECRSSRIYIFRENDVDNHIAAIDPIKINQVAISYAPKLSIESLQNLNKLGDKKTFSFTLHNDINFEVITNRRQSIGSEASSWFEHEQSRDYWIHMTQTKKEINEETQMATYYYEVVFDADNLTPDHEDYNTLGRQAYIMVIPLDSDGKRYVELGDTPDFNRYYTPYILCHQSFNE